MRVQLRNHYIVAMPTPLALRKAVSWRTGRARSVAVAGVPSPWHVFIETSREPRRAPCFSAIWAPGAAQPKDTWSPGGEGCPREKRTTLKRSLLLPRETGGAGKGRRAVLRFHSTDEGGEPQGSREGRPRHPLEGRDEQVDVSAQRHRHGTLNPGRHVKWS